MMSSSSSLMRVKEYFFTLGRPLSSFREKEDENIFYTSFFCGENRRGIFFKLYKDPLTFIENEEKNIFFFFGEN